MPANASPCWKARKTRWTSCCGKRPSPTEPADAQWDSAYGRGRPGWHIECSAMACALLGETFDIHGGGADLQFPHHENEIAQSEGANGKPLARYWMHNGFVNIDNEKMSKSLGNFFTIREVLKKFDAETLRFFLVRAHYRSPLNYSDVHLDDARGALKRLYTALDLVAPAQVAIDWARAPCRAASRRRWTTTSPRPRPWPCCSNWRPRSTAASRRKRRACSRRWAAAWASCRAIPRLFLRAGTQLDEATIAGLIEQRAAAKKAKNFAEADRIRNELLAQGIVLKDSPAGTTWEAAS